MGPQWADFGFERANLNLRWLILGLRGLNFVPKKTDFGLERADLGSERGLGGGDGRTDGRTDVWKFTPVSYRISALWGRCPKSMSVSIAAHLRGCFRIF